MRDRPALLYRAISWEPLTGLSQSGSDRSAFADRSALIFWGFKDVAFRKKELKRWQSALSDVETHEFKDHGHFLAEEAPEELLPRLRAFLNASSR